MADEKKLAELASLDEKAFGPKARAERKVMLEKLEKGDYIGAAAAAAKGGYEGIKHGFAHPVDATVGEIELRATPSAERKDYIAREKSR